MEVLHTVDERRIAQLRRRDEFFWIDLESPSEEELRRLGDALDLHHLALEDTIEFGQPPKADHFGDHLLLVFYAACMPTPTTFRPLEVHVHLHGAFIVTVRRGGCDQLDHAIASMPDVDGTDEELVIYRVLDALADSYDPVIVLLDERVDELEAEVFGRPHQRHLQAIYALKQDVQALGRRAAAQRDRFPAAAGDILALPGLERSAHPYMSDVEDHLREVAGNLQRFENDLVSLTDTFFNASANRLNQQASRLSVIATIFLVATLITGFFGQNFGWLVDSIDSRADFLVYGVGGLVGAVLLTGAYFLWRRRDYF